MMIKNNDYFYYSHLSNSSERPSAKAGVKKKSQVVTIKDPLQIATQIMSWELIESRKKLWCTEQ